MFQRKNVPKKKVPYVKKKMSTPVEGQHTHAVLLRQHTQQCWQQRVLQLFVPPLQGQLCKRCQAESLAEQGAAVAPRQPNNMIMIIFIDKDT